MSTVSPDATGTTPVMGCVRFAFSVLAKTFMAPEPSPEILVHRQDGTTGEAIAHRELVVAQLVDRFGETHPHVLSSRCQLASMFLSAGRIGESIALHEQVLAQRRQHLGASHPHLASSRCELACAYRSVGRISEAIALQEKAVVQLLELLGESHPLVTIAQDDLHSMKY